VSSAPTASTLLAKSESTAGDLVELNAYTLFFAPYDMARHLDAIVSNDKGEARRDADGAGNIKCRSFDRHIADDAVDRAAAELDCSCLQHPTSMNSALFHIATVPADSFPEIKIDPRKITGLGTTQRIRLLVWSFSRRSHSIASYFRLLS